jgi:hypothetical protein
VPEMESIRSMPRRPIAAVAFSVSGALTLVSAVVPSGNDPVQGALFSMAWVLLTVGLLLLGGLLRSAGWHRGGVAVLWVAAAAVLSAAVGSVFESGLGPVLADVLWLGGQYLFFLAAAIASVMVLTLIFQPG